MANKALPKNVHLLKGTHKKHRHGDKKSPEIKSAVKISTRPPVHLGHAAKIEWKRIIKVSKSMGLLTAADHAVLSQYCMLYGDMVAANKEFPFTAAQHTALRLCSVEMGFTPSARTKFSGPAKKAADEYADY